MGFFSEMDIEVREMIARGFDRKTIAQTFPLLSEQDLDYYFNDDHDGDYEPEIVSR